jgi:hypothetical protein
MISGANKIFFEKFCLYLSLFLINLIVSSKL